MSVINLGPHEKIEPGEWTLEKETGRYFRVIGNCKEYAMEFAHPQPTRNPEAERIAREDTMRKEKEAYTGKLCPFKSGLNTTCIRTCPLYGETDCVFVTKESIPQKETAGEYCPLFGRNCSENCALYRDGCGFRNLVNNLFSERKDK